MGDGEIAQWKSATDNGVDVKLYDDDFTVGVDGSGYVYEFPYDMTAEEVQTKIKHMIENTDFFRQSSIKVSVINLAFYIPSHDMIVSVLIEIRFDLSGSVRTRTFEVLPFQITSVGDSNDEQVLHRNRVVTAFSIIRLFCCTYTLFIIYIKFKYREVIGTRFILSSIFRDLI